jgi:hypothetical protein
MASTKKTAAPATPPPSPDPAETSETLAAAGKARAEAAAAKHANPGMVDALLEERRGYVQRGFADRIAAVDEQIRFYGGQPPAED